MNNKAIRRNIVFPLTLNLAETRTQIDSKFQSAEKQNTPFINNTHSPLFIKNIPGSATYDKYGSRYTISNGVLIKNDGLIEEELFDVTSRHFERNKINDPSTIKERVLSYGPNGYNLRFDDTDNSISLYQNNVKKQNTGHLYSVGNVLCSRVYYQDGKVLGIALVKYSSDYKVVFITDTQKNMPTYTSSNLFRQQLINSTTSTFPNVSPDNLMPLIQAHHYTFNNISFWVATVYSQYGQASNPLTNGFATFVYNETSNSVKQYGGTNSFTITRPTQTTDIVTTYTGYLSYKYNRSTSQTTKALLAKKNANGTYTYYDYSTPGVVGDVLNVPTTFRPSLTNQIITINNVNYTYGTYIYYTTTITSYCTLEPYAVGNSAVFSIGFNNGTAININVASGQTANQSKSASGFVAPDLHPTNVTAMWRSSAYNIPSGYWNNAPYIATKEETQTGVTISAAIIPTCVCDNGNLYALYRFSPTTDDTFASTDQLSNGYTIVESATITDISDQSEMTIAAIENFKNVKTTTMELRSNSFCVNPYFYYDWTRYTIGSKTPKALLTDKNVDNDNAQIIETINTNCTDLRTNAGSTLFTDYNFYGANNANTQESEGALIDYFGYVVGGFRVDINNNWHLLYNMLSDGQCLIQGISYSEDLDSIGTLVVPWTTVDNKFAPFVDTDGSLVYKENETDNLYRISLVAGAEVQSVLDNRYIIINTTSFWNAYDPILNKKAHFATDYNDRLMFGRKNNLSVIVTKNTEDSSVIETATAINYNYKMRPRNAFISIQLPIANRYFLDNDYSNIKAYSCNIPEDTDDQPIDVFYSEYGGTSCDYRFSLYNFSEESIMRVSRFNVYGTSHLNDETVTMNPSILAKFIDGSGSNDIVIEGSIGYPLDYSEDEPIFGYEYTSTTVLDDVGAFFTLQGQHYLIANDKLYTASYSNGILIAKDAIIDVRNMKFVGNNSMISFWFDPRNKALFTFTGDGVMKELFGASKLNDVTGKYFYEESTNSIYIPTSNGLLIIGPNNTYMLEDYKNVSNVYFCKDNLTYIINGNNTIALSYYKQEGFDVLPVDIETSFYGLGEKENGSIDRFDITLYDIDGSNEPAEIVIGVRSITDITVLSEEKSIKITPDMYDKWSNSVLISYSPKYVKGQGIRLYIKSPIAIQSITAHITDNGVATPTAIRAHI